MTAQPEQGEGREVHPDQTHRPASGSAAPLVAARPLVALSATSIVTQIVLRKKFSRESLMASQKVPFDKLRANGFSLTH